MSTGPNRIMDDFAKLMTDAAGAAQGVRKEMETAFHAQAERWLNGMDVVKREEFEAVREMAIKARVYGECYPIDEDFLAALALMPPAAGCALGFDRLVMLAVGAPRIADVIWVPAG